MKSFRIFLSFVTGVLLVVVFQNCGGMASLEVASSTDSKLLDDGGSFSLASTAPGARCRDINYTYQEKDQRSSEAVEFAKSEQARVQKIIEISLDSKQAINDGDLEPSGAIPSLSYTQNGTCPAEAPSTAICRTFFVGSPSGTAGSYIKDDGIRLRKIIEDMANYQDANPSHWLQLKFDSASNYYLRVNPFGDWALRIRGMSNLVIDGAGSNLWLSSFSQFISFYDCKNCVIKNMQVEHFDRTHTQGLVVGVGQSGGENFARIRVDEGFPLPPMDPLYSACADGTSPAGRGKLFKNFSHAAFYQGKLVDTQRPFLFMNGVQTANRTERLINVRFPAAMNLHAGGGAGVANRLQQLTHLGMKAAFHLPQNSNDLKDAQKFQAKRLFGLRDFEASAEAGYANFSTLMIANSSGVKVSNLAIHSSIKMTVRLSDNKGNLHFDNLRLEPRGASLIGGLSDGIHGGNNRGRTIIENSRFKSLMDDAIHIKAGGMRTSKKISSTEIVLARTSFGHGWEIRPGDVFQMIDTNRGTDLGKYSIVSAVPEISDKIFRYRVVFNRAVDYPAYCGEDLNPCVHFYNLNERHPNSLIQNNLFENSIRNAVLTHGDTKITGNWMEHMSGAIQLTHSSKGPEGPVGSSFPIGGNVALDIAGPPILSWILTNAAPQNPAPHTGLEAHCNIFETLGSKVVDFSYVHGRMARNLYYRNNFPTTPVVPSTVAILEPITQDPASESWCTSNFPMIANLAKYKNRASFLALGLPKPPEPPKPEPPKPEPPKPEPPKPPRPEPPLPPVVDDPPPKPPVVDDPPPQRPQPPMPPKPPVGTKILGVFRVPNGGIYHGYKDTYCWYGNMKVFTGVWGANWARISKNVAALPTGMTYQGSCSALQGVHKDGSMLVYVNRSNTACWINSMARALALTDLTGEKVSHMPNKDLVKLGILKSKTGVPICQ